jgi:hypothetical protein
VEEIPTFELAFLYKRDECPRHTIDELLVDLGQTPLESRLGNIDAVLQYLHARVLKNSIKRNKAQQENNTKEQSGRELTDTNRESLEDA